MHDQWLRLIPQEIGWYLAGFADGEGSFNVSLRHRSDFRMEWQPVLTFNVSQRDITNLVLLKRYLGCGRLQHRADGVHYYVVSNPRAIAERVLPFFERFTFFSASKKKNFSIFRRIAKRIDARDHLTREGLHDIAVLREGLNEGRGRKRKYNLDDVTHKPNPQRLYAEVSDIRNQKLEIGKPRSEF